MSSRQTRRGRHGPGGSPLTGYLFMAPYLVLFGMFIVAPAIYGVWISLHDWDFTFPNRPFVGLTNYTDLFDPLSVQYEPFWNGMTNTLIFTVASVPFLVAVPLGLAMLLSLKFPGRTFFRAIYFAPYVLGVAVIGLMWRYLLDGNFGLINAILGLDIQWTTEQPWAWIGLVGVTLWWTMGFNAIIYLAGLGDIPQHLYEAAALDGAGAWQRFLHVTLPGLRPVLIFILVTTILASANMFGQSYMITQGGPTESTRTAIMVITETGFGQNRAGQAAAMSYLLAIALGVISILNFVLLRDKDQAAENRTLRRAAKKARTS
ncbi:carbohydrate ABC transporter permease [Tessaracoccus caeni]|uniref:carbohydrate ABC transporter permease n=1 Tax=Tessaracoccus caeni TaxID=3031239 RepID=UPI0023DA74DF|nr:sugar ABC transporter permease [Tessaracoccus caeni]MDF1487647.1 sugar ABC transporter permease [Tessaracoccus caeni]